MSAQRHRAAHRGARTRLASVPLRCESSVGRHWGGGVVALALLLAGCNLQPIYAGGGGGVVAATLGGIAVAPIADRAGYLVRNALQARLGHPGRSAAYRLEVELDDRIEGFGIRGDDSITRERRTLRARYRLTSADGLRTYLDASARADAGIDVVRSSDYATLAAESAALERLTDELARQIAARVALLVRTSPDFPARVAPTVASPPPGAPKAPTADTPTAPRQ